jgi:hypothetical protein
MKLSRKMSRTLVALAASGAVGAALLGITVTSASASSTQHQSVQACARATAQPARILSPASVRSLPRSSCRAHADASKCRHAAPVAVGSRSVCTESGTPAPVSAPGSQPRTVAPAHRSSAAASKA